MSNAFIDVLNALEKDLSPRELDLLILDLVKQYKERRDANIYEQALDGEQIIDIAKKYNLSQPRVTQIVKNQSSNQNSPLHHLERWINQSK